MRKFLFTVARLALLVPMLGVGFLSYIGRELAYHLALRLAFEPRPDDIFIVCYPKSGTTLLQQMVYQITTDGSMDIPHINAVVPWLDIVLLTNPEFTEQMPSPRSFKSHRTVQHLLGRGKIIYCVRNPKDACVSSFHHVASLHNDRSTLSVYVQRFIRGRVDWGSWFKHLEACFPYRHRDGVLFISFDQLRTDLEGVVTQVSKFCGVELDEAKRRAVVERCDIGFMKQHGSKFDPRLATLGDTEQRRPSPFIRKGEVGHWYHDLSPAHSALIEAKLKDTLQRLPRAEGDDLSFLASGTSDVKGCVCLHAADEQRQPQKQRPAELSVDGLRLFQPVAGLKPGDRVVLRLDLNGRKRDHAPVDPIVSRARVAAVGENDGCVQFEFSSPDPGFVSAIQQLEQTRLCLVLAP